MNKIVAGALTGGFIVLSVLSAMYFATVPNGWGFLVGYALAFGTAVFMREASK